jgi:hypothetical protein
MEAIMIIAAYLLSLFSLIVSASQFLRLRAPYGFYQIIPGSISPILVLLGILGAGLGWFYHVPVAVVAGLLGMGIALSYIVRVTAAQPGFALAFGKDWQRKIYPAQESRLLKRRWSVGLPRTGEPLWERDIPFWTIPGTDRKLLCDVWQPP